MAIKPGSFFTHATNATFVTAGLAFGQPTKVAIPIPAEGFIPDQETIPEYLNTILNAVGDYTVWLNAGSSAGAADAHVVETDANGDAAVQDLAVVDLEASGDASVGGDLSVDDGYIREGWNGWRQDFYTNAGSWPGSDYYQWSTGGNGSSTIVGIGTADGPTRLEMTSGPVSSDTHQFGHDLGSSASTNHAYIFEVVARVTSLVTTMRFEFGPRDVAVPIESGVTGVAFVYDTTLGDTNWTLVGNDGGGGTVRDASSIAVVQNVWHKFRVEVATDGSAELFIDGVSEATLPAATIGTNPGRFQGYCGTNTGANRTVEISRIQFWEEPHA